jgi:hypothetical protein
VARDPKRRDSLAELTVTEVFGARRHPGMTSIALMAALTTPHAGMPMFMLTAERREDIIAYILGLR